MGEGQDETRQAVAERYRAFADQQARGSSATYEAWARAVAEDPDLLALLADLPVGKQQPNLVLAAARVHGATPGDRESLRGVLLGEWHEVRETILTHATQTNEPARGAVMALGLSRLGGPLALIEVGASAGLCLAFDRYTYRLSDGTVLAPESRSDEVVIDVQVTGAWPDKARVMPDVRWRAGLDLSPLDVRDEATMAWLTTLVWPEHEDRRSRLAAAGRLAAGMPLDLRQGDLLEDLPSVLRDVPEGLTPVVMHSATLAYLGDEDRRCAVDLIRGSGAHWLSFEGRGVAPGVTVPDGSAVEEAMGDTLFVAALDGQAFALADGHARHLHLLPEG